MRAKRTGLWQHADFMKMWIGQTVSEFGSHISGIALGLTAILLLKATPLQMGLLTAMEIAPLLIFGLWAGAWIDRLRRRPLLIAADLGRAMALAFIPLAAYQGVLRIELLYGVGFITGFLRVFFEVADPSYLPTLLSREELIEGNSKRSFSSSLAEIGGPAVAGGLVQLLTAPFAILLDSGSFLVSAACISLIRAPEPLPAEPEAHDSTVRAIGEGLRLLWSDPILRALAGSAAMLSLFGSVIGALYSLYLIRVLSVPPVLLGVIIGAGGIGALPGAMLAERMARRFGVGRTLLGAVLAGEGINMLMLAAGGPVSVVVPFLMAVQVLGDIAGPIFVINEISLRQALIPHGAQGRVNASLSVLSRGLALPGALAGGALAVRIGIRPTLLLAFVGLVVLLPLWIALSPIRNLRTLPSHTEQADGEEASDVTGTACVNGDERGREEQPR